MKISTKDAKGVLTKALADVMRERTAPMSFMRSFFKEKEYATASISIEVERGTERVAADVYRGSEGNRNRMGATSEKMFIPPYFREFFDVTELDLYDRMFGSDMIDTVILTQMVSDITDKLKLLCDKIDRAYEKQCADVVQTGIVTLSSGTNIDFKRKAGSMQDLSATPWTSDSNNPIDHLIAGAKFVREKGKSQGGTLNVLMGETAFSAFLNNAKVKGRADIKNYSLDSLSVPQKNAVGASFHGEVSIGSYLGRIWTYPEGYENSGGTFVKYLDDKKIVILPEAPRFLLAYAAVPQLIDLENPIVKKGKFVFGDYKDLRKKTHEYDVCSAGVAIPVAVDQIYTAQVIA